MSQVTSEKLMQTIQDLQPRDDRPIFVAISGFGGSGKSTLAKEISSKLPSSTVIPIDDFIIGARTERSGDWQTFDRTRLRNDVIEPAHIGKVLKYQKYNSGDWVNNKGGALVEVTIGQVVIIEGCGILHPDLLPYYDCSAWINLSQERALESAKKRDANETELFGDDDTERLWDEVWGPNDREFFATFRPDLRATVLVEPQF